MIIVILVGLYLGILLIDFRIGMKSAGVWAKVFYIATLTVGVALALAHEFGLNIASPAIPIDHAVSAIFKIK